MCHDKRNGGRLDGNISRNGYGNAIIGSYGGCFEEDIRRFMCDMIRSITHKPPYIFLKTATIPTYYGISIAIPRYIAMELSYLPIMAFP